MSELIIFIAGFLLGYFISQKFAIKTRKWEEKHSGDIHLQLLKIQEMIRDIRGG